MRYLPRKRCYFALFFLTFFALCIGVIELLNRNQQELHKERVQVEAKEQLSILRSNLEAVLMADIYKASTLATL
ncbi:sensor domain-containing diguanylate cyclase, partial [Vibrio parahaemolyticus]|nr:sensor domain-containing diguanylate cyclase [Vibrio parahaemolyticus]